MCLLGIMIGSVGFYIALVLPQCVLANTLNAGPEVLTGVCLYVLGQVVMYLDYFTVKTKALSSFAKSVTLYQPTRCNISEDFNSLNPELNPICYLLALLGAHHFLHVSRIRVKLLTFRLLMSYIYIWSTHS